MVTGDEPQRPADWTEAESWAWGRIAAGEIADFNGRDRESKPDFQDLDPAKADGWPESRRLRAKAFLQRIVTDKAFVEATPFGGVRILGALIDDAPIMLEHARLQRLLWLEKSRILVPVKARNLRVDGELSLEASFVAGEINVSGADIKEMISLADGRYEGPIDLLGVRIGSELGMRGSTFEGPVNLNGASVENSAFLRGGATFKGEVDLGSARIGKHLEMDGSTFKGELNLGGIRIGSDLGMIGSTFEGPVDLNGATIEGGAFLREGATFNGELNLGSASIGSDLDMRGSIFEAPVNLDRATVEGAAFLRGGATFRCDLNLGNARIGSTLDMTGSTFEGPVSLHGAKVQGLASLSDGATFKGELNLVSASIGSALDMTGSTFEGPVSLDGATVQGSAFLRDGATFKGAVDLFSTGIGSDLDLSGAEFRQPLDLTGARIGGEFRLGSSRHLPARWGKDAALVLRNTHCGALQDWWDSKTSNDAWPTTNLELGGFTYARLGGLYSEGAAADMLARPASCYVQWLARDATFSPQPYEILAQAFRQAGEPEKATDILYAARERQREALLASVGGTPLERAGRYLSNGPKWLGMALLKWTIGYGLGGRYFRALLWVAGLSLIGVVWLHDHGAQAEKGFWPLLLASFDNLLPLIELDKAHEALIYGDAAAKPPVTQPFALKVYFYLQKISGWVLGSFLVAGLAGITQRN